MTQDATEKPAKRTRGRTLWPANRNPNGGRKLMSTVKIRAVTFRVDQLYCIKEVALILDVATRTVERWIAQGKLTAYKLGDGEKAPVRIHGRTILALLKKVTKIRAQQKRKQETGAEE